MVPVLAVDLPAEPAAANANQAILAACDEALRPRRCPPAPGAGQAPIRVRWPSGERVEIDDWDGRNWRHQTLAFDESDDSAERWRAVGLVVAALAGGGRQAEIPEDSRPVARPRVKRTPHAPPVLYDLVAAGSVGPGATADAWRSGPALSAGMRWRSVPIGLRLSGSAAFGRTRDPEVEVAWVSAALGPYVAFEVASPLRLSLGFDAGWEWLHATMTDERQSESRSYATLRPWLAGALPLSSWVGVRAGAELPITPGHAVRVDGRTVGENPSLGVLALAGLEFWPVE